ncbi:MAG TPA: hypothetical protein VFQ83_00730 [Candidatus Udaeobacter sp.]|jgi:hypothetical protein|nr:hypothetical protein [Candidatus Udaeobacter sp.]
MKKLLLTTALVVVGIGTLLGNGGAWQTGVPGTGSASASNQNRKTNVRIEEEALKIDLHSGYAAVEVHYQMHNTGSKVEQEFFFPVERWGKNPDADTDTKSADVDDYRITVDGKKLSSTNISGPKEEATRTTSGQFWDENISTIKSWKKSLIPFERNQTREVTVRYRAQYAENDESVSDDSHISNATFAYSLSPAATWKGPIGKGKIEINILHPEPEDVSIEKPKERFKKNNETHYEWTFENLKPTVADDIRIIAHSKYDKYPTGYSEEDFQHHASYVLKDHQYFLDHTDYDATASSTLAAQGKHNYDVVNIKGDPTREIQSPWAEGVDGDGIGESITLTVKRPLPLYGILIRPGYYDYDNKDVWLKNNRVAELEITLNDEHTFTENIPDEQFEDPYLIRIRDYAKPVNKIKLVIKGVHRGTQFRDTCISLIELRAALAKKPEIQAAR